MNRRHSRSSFPMHPMPRTRPRVRRWFRCGLIRGFTLFGLLFGPLLALLLAGCAGGPEAAATRAAKVPVYPAKADHGPNLEIYVTRRGDHIQLVNTTPRAYRHLDLWLNRQYVRRVKQLAIGDDNSLDLAPFLNRFGEHYPTGSFLRPEDSARLVLAELYNPRTNLRYRLVVQPIEHEASGAATRPTRTGARRRRHPQ